MLKSKQKYIVGMATAAILFTSPLTSAAEDEDIVIFGDNLEPVKTEKTKTSETPEPVVVVEEPSEPVVVDNEENQNNQEIEIQESDNHSEDENQNSNDDENNSPVEKIDGNPSVNNLNSDENNNDDDYTVGENINFSTEKVKNNKENVNRIESFDNNYNDSRENIDNYDSKVKSYSDNIETSNNEDNYSSFKDSTNPYINKNRNGDNKNQTGEQKVIKARFIKLLSDDNYDYYLDRHSVNWVKIPYFSNEYMADVWIRMLDRTQNEEEMPSDLYNYTHEVSDEVSEAAAKGKIYNEVDVKVLRTKKYFLEHYYLRPKTKQIQFLCELEVVGRPQNAVSERAYDYKNWENLIPGSVEFAIYYGVISDIGTSKASTRGHRTFIDMLDEYARIALN